MHIHGQRDEAGRPNVATGPGSTRAPALVTLQRLAGNRAVTAALGRGTPIAVQRDLDAGTLFPTHYDQDLALFDDTPVVMSDNLRQLPATEKEPTENDKWDADTVYGELKGCADRYTEHQRTAQENLDAAASTAKAVTASSPPPRDLVQAQTLLATRATLVDDRWTPDYVSEFLYRQLLLSASDVPATYPTELLQNPGSDAATGALVRYRLLDQDGREFGGLRGTSGTSALFYRWLSDHGGDPAVLGSWFGGQRGSSWSTASTMAKFFYTAFRNVGLDQYFWHTDLAAARRKVGAPVWLAGEAWPSRMIEFTVPYINSLISQHVLTHDLLHHTRVPNMDLMSRTVTLIRLENQAILKSQTGEVEPAKNEHITLTRGPAESFSLVESYKDPKAEGHALGPFYVTTQSVPLHRVFATYFQSKPDEPDTTILLGDGENEFIVMSEGLKAVFHGTDG